MRNLLFLLLATSLIAGACGEDSTQRKFTDTKPTTTDSIRALYDQADSLYDQGKYGQAKENMKRAYASFELLKVKDADIRVIHLRMLCYIAIAMKEIPNAIAYANELTAHSVKEEDGAFALSVIGRVYQEKGDLDKAIGYFEKSLAIDLKTLEPDDPDLAYTCVNLGSAHDLKGKYDKAISYYEKSLAIAIKVLGSEHLNIGYTYANLASAHELKGDYDKAIKLLKKSLAIMLKKLGSRHLEVASAYQSLGKVYAKKGDKPKAKAFLLKARAIFVKKLGPKHPDRKRTQALIDKLK
jgi:tetratricopeptide (TPR) repeat protein